MNHSDDTSAPNARALLTQQANTVRARMLRRIDVLQARRHALGRAISEIRVEGKHLLPAVAGAAITTAAVVVVLLRARATAKRRRAGWHMPTLRSKPAHEPGLIRRSLQGAAVSLAIRLLQRAAEHAAKRWLATRPGMAPALPARSHSPAGAAG